VPIATVLLQATPHYKREAWARGLAALGYEIAARNPRPSPDDLILTWNRRAPLEQAVRTHERAGARALVAENGYLPRTRDGAKFYALALGHHNGAGAWRVGGPDRWASFGIELQPWREAGEHIVILPQRGFGPPGVAMPSGWPQRAFSELRRRTKRRIVVRHHPGQDKTEPYEALRGAHAAVTWGSGAAIKALAVGCPVFHEFPRWIGAPAARLGLLDLEEPWLGDCRPMFERLAWAQWTLAEIERGDAFAWLLGSSGSSTSPPA
jgi:hypothetical protein